MIKDMLTNVIRYDLGYHSTYLEIQAGNNGYFWKKLGWEGFRLINFSLIVDPSCI